MSTQSSLILNVWKLAAHQRGIEAFAAALLPVLQAAIPVLEGLGARHWEVLEMEVAQGFVPTRAVVVVAGHAVREGGPLRNGGAGRRRRA
jgi:hypothetical protein